MKISRFYVNHDEIEKVVQLYDLVWDQQDSEMLNRLKRHSSYPGFVGLVAHSKDNEITGFIYGYTSLTGQYYHGILQEGLEEEKDFWLHNCFELVEIAVHPEYRKKKVAESLLNNLQTYLHHRTAILTTQTNNIPARRLYGKNNWLTIRDDFYPVKEGPPYVIMGKLLLSE
ncbi:GNAT family N-acetyltransferase [Ornithinibacillus sp. L9]|uniref:GNAT family N-acetyltransferase n=1 Tax=Ornithinibacillus caprae TaxID=2678566 RepID=A0A6N8FH39_9BACI|nr:GNAT family N-acetyltransferase [Ornithinibacillus caprae]MUK88890.1 GNAT family N-acetyltransferase [Ornithinibacillus caprae]